MTMVGAASYVCGICEAVDNIGGPGVARPSTADTTDRLLREAAGCADEDDVETETATTALEQGGGGAIPTNEDEALVLIEGATHAGLMPGAPATPLSW